VIILITIALVFEFCNEQRNLLPGKVQGQLYCNSVTQIERFSQVLGYIFSVCSSVYIAPPQVSSMVLWWWYLDVFVLLFTGVAQCLVPNVDHKGV
jgi:hypothetical protein